MWDIGYHGTIAVREEPLPLLTTLGIRVLYVSDLHFNRFGGHIVRQVAAIIEQQHPDILLLGGDYVDTSGGLAHLQYLLDAIRDRDHVYAVAGNHDYFFGLNQLKNRMVDCGITWIEKATATVMVRGHEIRIDGNQPSGGPRGAALRVLCLHQPVSLNWADNPYDLILAGHLHGSQVVWWQNDQGLYPGRWFYRWNIRRQVFGHCLYLVSQGVGDTLPVRYNCGREILLVG